MNTMFCTKCGRELRDGAKFCNYCGSEIIKDNPNKSKINAYAQIFVPKAWIKRFPNIPAVAFVTSYVVVFVLAVTLIAAGVNSASHDLSGTYYYNGRFPVTQITFSKDGTFTARCTYYEYDVGDVYYGKYSKSFGKYELKFTGGKSGGGNPVEQAKLDGMSGQMSMQAEKNEDGSLTVTIIPGISYYAWAGSYATFYRSGY